MSAEFLDVSSIVAIKRSDRTGNDTPSPVKLILITAFWVLVVRNPFSWMVLLHHSLNTGNSGKRRVVEITVKCFLSVTPHFVLRLGWSSRQIPSYLASSAGGGIIEDVVGVMVCVGVGVEVCVGVGVKVCVGVMVGVGVTEIVGVPGVSVTAETIAVGVGSGGLIPFSNKKRAISETATKKNKTPMKRRKWVSRNFPILPSIIQVSLK